MSTFNFVNSHYVYFPISQLQLCQFHTKSISQFVHFINIDKMGIDIAGIHVVGNHVVGIDIAGIHVVGNHVVGIDVVGIDVVGNCCSGKLM